jgi:hypothetical protein
VIVSGPAVLPGASGWGRRGAIVRGRKAPRFWKAGNVMAAKPTPVQPPNDSAVLILAEAICDAQLILAECLEQDLPDAPRTLSKLHVILNDQAVIEALKAIGYVHD